MDTIEQYKIIESQDLGSLAEKVNAALKEGWQPLGAPFIHVSGAAVVCCQAMVNFHQPTSAETIAKLRRAAASVFRLQVPAVCRSLQRPMLTLQLAGRHSSMWNLRQGNMFASLLVIFSSFASCSSLRPASTRHRNTKARVSGLV